MSEEEIIEYIEKIKQDYSIRIIGENNVSGIISTENFNRITAIQGLLDLYNKEKEKNKELENADLSVVYMNGFYDGEKKWKDKIKVKIEYYKLIDNDVGVRILENLLKNKEEK